MFMSNVRQRWTADHLRKEYDWMHASFYDVPGLQRMFLAFVRLSIS